MNRKFVGPTTEKYDVVVCGGGAAGMLSAIQLKMLRPEQSVVILEKNAELGRKVKATGNGRCNISNTDAEGYEEIMSFMRSLGLVLRVYENGLVYPYSESAADVVKLLRTRIDELGVAVITGAEVYEVKPAEAGYAVKYRLDGENGGREFGRDKYGSRESGRDKYGSREKGRDKYGSRESCRKAERRAESSSKTCSKLIEAKCLILAVGGKAGPVYGTTGDGYSIARSLGHAIITPVPVLTGIECSEWASETVADAKQLAGTRSNTADAKQLAGTRSNTADAKQLAGVRCRATIRLYRNPEQSRTEEDKIFEESGELQFTKYGLSGICVFNTSRHMRYNKAAGESMEQFLIKADLYDGDILEFLERRVEIAGKHESAHNLLMTLLKEAVAEYVLIRSGVPATAKIAELSREQLERIAGNIHGLAFHPTGVKGWKEAQASAGGVSLEEIDGDTCESKLHKNLYIVGELADYDGPCGGYNLSNAWLTGLKAARGIANESL